VKGRANGVDVRDGTRVGALAACSTAAATTGATIGAGAGNITGAAEVQPVSTTAHTERPARQGMGPEPAYILNTPNRGASGIGAFRLAERPSASTRRVSAGSITPSSHSRALA
jgi:hypothetical protein